MEKNLTPEQSLSIIEQAITNARQKIEENGTIYILWGTLVALASFGQYYFLKVGKPEISWYPYLMLPLGGIASMLIKIKEEKKGYNPLGRLTAILWGSTSLNIMILGFGFYGYLLKSLVPVILVLIGLAMIVHGTMLKSNLIWLPGIIINIAGFVCFTLEWQLHPLVNGFAAVLGFLIPGIVLYQKHKKHHV